MSDTLEQPGVLHRIRYTPLRDVVRGRITGRLDLRRRIESAALPAPAAELVKRVVRRTRLWRLERVDVAEELIAHFADGIAAGEPVEDLVASFGDERRAARLITRAKRRGRPLPWHLLDALRWALIVLIAGYLVLGIYFYLGRPSPSVDYIARLNQPIERVPEDQRGWPLYRQAILSLGMDRTNISYEEFDKRLSAEPGSRQWPAMVEWLEKHADSVELMRQAAARPTVGFVLGTAGSYRDPQMWPSRMPGAATAGVEQPVITVALPHLIELRTIAQLLSADATIARAAAERERLIRDLVAICEVAEQLSKEDFLIPQLVALSIRQIALLQIERTLIEAPQLLTDGDLRDLAHRLSGPQTAADLFHLAGERMIFYDAIQRAYTDDGQGDGRLTPRGLQTLTEEWATPTAGEPGALHFTAGPATLLFTQSRKQTLQTYDSIMDATEAQLARPLREAKYEAIDGRLLSMQQDTRTRLKHLPIATMVPTLSRAHEQAERYLGRRDGVLLAIALELHRRRNDGRYPASLDELTPGLLPDVPMDRIVGGPVRYRIEEGRPIIYSLGADADDDAGRVPVSRDGSGPGAWTAASWTSVTKAPPADGDWVLYPHHDPELEKSDESDQ